MYCYFSPQPVHIKYSICYRIYCTQQSCHSATTLLTLCKPSCCHLSKHFVITFLLQTRYLIKCYHSATKCFSSVTKMLHQPHSSVTAVLLPSCYIFTTIFLLLPPVYNIFTLLPFVIHTVDSTPFLLQTWQILSQFSYLSASL